MAQRTIHYLFGEMFSRQIELKDKNRFLLGSILPDAYSDDYKRDSTHFKCKSNNKVYFDFNRFREQYFELMQKDDLYLGYYMHLVEDALYRQFIHKKKLKMPCNKEEVMKLHNDYHILNAYIVKQYNIQNSLEKPIDLKRELICQKGTFKIYEFLENMAQDFKEKPLGTTVFLTENMLDEFIDMYLVLGVKELQSVIDGKYYLQAIDYAWPQLVLD